MDKLMLITGFAEDEAILNIKHLAERYFSGNNLLKIWIDPYKETRAVLMFQNAIELDSIIHCHYREWKSLRMVFGSEKPANSIFIRTYNAEYYGLIDKLGYLITKKSNYTVSKKIKKEDGCFEFSLTDGWDAVSAVCEKEWKLGDAKLMVCPFFDGFKEPYDEQFEKLMAFSKTALKANSKNNELNNTTNLHNVDNKTEKVISYFYFKDKFMSDILYNLNIVDAFKSFGCELILNDQEAEIIGSKNMVRKLHEVITIEESTVNESIAPLIDIIYLEVDKELIKEAKYSLIISQVDEKLIFYVAEKKNQKTLFQEFVTTKQIFFGFYKFQHHFCIAILEVLDLKAAVEKKHSRMTLDYDHLNKKVKITGFFHEILSFTTVLQREEQKISVTEMQKSFLEDKNVLHKIKKLNHSIDSGELSVNVGSGIFHNFSKYINELIITDKITIEKNKSENWMSYIDSFNKTNKLSKISVLEIDIFLMSLNCEGSVHYILLQSIKDNLLLPNKYTEKKSLQTNMDNSFVLNTTKEKNDDNIKIDSFSMWVLNQLKMKQALANKFNGICINYDPKSSDFFIEPSSHSSQVGKEITKLCKLFSFTKKEYSFLNTEEAKSHLEERIKLHSLHFEIDKDGDDFFLEVYNSKHKKIDFDKFLEKLLYTELVLNLKENQILSASKFWHYVNSFNARNPNRCLIVQDRMVILLTVSEDDFAWEIKEINDFVLKLSGLKPLYNHHHLFPTTYFTVHLKKKNEYEYFQMIIDDFKNAEGVFDVELNQTKLTVVCLTRFENSLFEKISFINENIQSLEEDLAICGLQEFIQTAEGQNMIFNISQSTKCYIQVVGNKIQHSREMEEITVESYDFKAILLQTAKCQGFNIHLVQGKIDDLVIEMSIHLTPSEKGEIHFRRIRSQHWNLFLPPWFADSKNFDKLQLLRSDLQNKISVIFGQAKALNYFDIAFCMERMHDAQYPFPLDLLAQIILQKLIEITSSNDTDLFDAFAVPEFNIYICEPKHDSVFKAFQYFLKKCDGFFGFPDQEQWEKISPLSTSRYPCYSENKVEVRASNPYNVEPNISFCYPILPCLNASTCPVVNESGVSLSLLEDSLKSIEDVYPDGIPVNECFAVQCFPYIHKNVTLYCSPLWGTDSSEAIFESLKKCLSLFKNDYAVHIVPPGVWRSSKYPSKYLAQSVFKTLDRLYEEGLCPKNLKIVFIVADTEYKKEFDKELSKRLQKNSSDHSLISSVISFLPSFLTFSRAESPPVVQTSVVEKTKVVFVSHIDEQRLSAATELKSYLNDLMSKNTAELFLTKEEICTFKKIVEKKQYFHPVFLEYTGKIDKSQIFKAGSGPKLVIKGLSKKWVTDFKKSVSTHAKIFKLEDEKSQGKNSSVDPSTKTKGKKTENEGIKKHRDTFDGLEDKSSNSLSHSHNSQKETKILKTNFTWKYEKLDVNDFEEFNTEVIKNIEQFYSVDATNNKKLKGTMYEPFNCIDFKTMTIKTKNKQAFPLIRSEILQEDIEIGLPGHWTNNDDDDQTFHLIKIDHRSLKQERVMIELTKTLAEYDNFEINKIEEVENKKLFERFHTKKILLKHPKQQTLWHRVSEEGALKVCQFGFHKAFSAYPEDFSCIGHGVAFTSRLDDCLFIKENEMKSDIFLIYADVLTGNSVRGDHSLRSLPMEKQTHQEYHSAYENDIFMIFSDAQAYPLYCIQLKNKKKKQSNKHKKKKKK